ncbi:MAG: DUF3261 domain-containing protein, partial [Planctomycetes bacterium]|nr:DUF3261 domain-containing protein [Planctomycetota bacterium]
GAGDVCVGGAIAAMNVRLCLLCLAAGCAGAPDRSALRESDYPGTLRPPRALPFDVVWQQRVTASWGDGQQRGFDAAVQKRDDTLTVLGLSPMGSVGFSIVMPPTGALEVSNATGEAMPFPPRFILLDVQRAFYPWLEPVEAAGDRTGEVDGETIVEIWRDGRLRRRVFTRADRAGQIRVDYEWGEAGWRGPTHVRLANGWFGYELAVDTHAETLLPAAEGTGR